MDSKSLPPGQHEISEFPHFGLSKFAKRIPDVTTELTLDLSGDGQRSVRIDWIPIRYLERVQQTSDFHCVTTWSRRSLQWGGVRFRDFYEQVFVPGTLPESDAQIVIFRCRDGYSTSMLLEDALAADVLLADSLDNKPLSIEHGAPLRIVAPQHYGYKNVKHLRAIEIWRDYRKYRPAALPFMDHPRARVLYEERGRGIPGWLLRYLYRPLIAPTVRQFKRGLEAHFRTQ
jgi:DMSO/TMAO reductase YedYZ molybdopterin-dependent catalytic subunit